MRVMYEYVSWHIEVIFKILIQHILHILSLLHLSAYLECFSTEYKVFSNFSIKISLKLVYLGGLEHI